MIEGINVGFYSGGQWHNTVSVMMELYTVILSGVRFIDESRSDRTVKRLELAYSCAPFETKIKKTFKVRFPSKIKKFSNV